MQVAARTLSKQRPFSQKALMQSLATKQAAPMGQAAQGPPQSTLGSPWFLMLSSQVGFCS
jgi:hypothetical protein